MLKTMINAVLAFSLMCAASAHGAWNLIGVTYHDCQNPSAIREGLCAEGGEWVVPASYIEDPGTTDEWGNKYNILEWDNGFVINTAIRVPVASKPGRGYLYYTLDTVRIADVDREPLGLTYLYVFNQANRDFTITKQNLECGLTLRGVWTGLSSNSPPLPNPLIDATFKYRNTDCED